MHEIFQISEHVQHIHEIEDDYFSIIRGTERAIVVDAAYGIGNNREFVEQHLNVPYILINSHGHFDHVLGDWQFDEAWLHKADLPAWQFANSRSMRMSVFFQYVMTGAAAKEAAAGAESEREQGEGKIIPAFISRALTKEDKNAYTTFPATVIHPLDGDEEYDLGGVHVQLVHLPGHTKGEIGLLVREDRLLVAGDSFSTDCFMFYHNHDTLETLANTCEKALALPFDKYLLSHSTELVPRDFLEEVAANAREKHVVPGSEEVILGCRTLTIRHEGPHGVSQIRVNGDGSF